MRYEIPVYFQMSKNGEYDASTGDYADATITEVKKYASVHDSGAETMNLIYGELKPGVVTVQLQHHFKPPSGEGFSRIRIGQKVYRVDFSRKLRTKHTFVCSEVQ